MPIRQDFPYDKAATLPVALLTMHAALYHPLPVGKEGGKRVRSQEASDGVGLMALQIAKLKAPFSHLFRKKREKGKGARNSWPIGRRYHLSSTF